MNLIRQIIIDKIKNEGPISFKTFMEMALYYPGQGYYSSPKTIIGRGGDFYTSPHLHPIFGAMLCRQLLEIWKSLGKPELFDVVEIGAGLGYICKDIFNYLHKSEKLDNKDSFLDALKYIIVEPFAHFENKQKEVLNEDSSIIREGFTGLNVSWVKNLKELKGITGCILSNELLDAFPVHMVEMGDEPREIFLNFDGNNFIEEKKSLSSNEIEEYINIFLINLRSGYRTEINLQIKKWLEEISRVLNRGYVLTIDYGYSAREYYSNDRSKGTLLCYNNHQYNENPYDHIGKQDITAHVNFSSLKLWGEELGFKTVGYCPQGTFLTASGIDEVITELYSDSTGYLSEISRIKGLIMPQGMGVSHSVMVQYKGEGAPELRGFSMRNQTDIL